MKITERGMMDGVSQMLPPQEIILVWVFVKHLHFQFLTRHFMDNHLTHRHINTNTHTMYRQPQMTQHKIDTNINIRSTQCR